MRLTVYRPVALSSDSITLAVHDYPQSMSSSPYLDYALFQYDEKLVSSSERPKPVADHPIKFLSRTRRNRVRFKLDLGTAASDGHTKRIASYVFHPTQPFVLSIVMAFMPPQVVNVHLRL
jgi:de-etiolated-1